ncbi:unnamed protein product [Parnassius mnemosyne]|uniref:Adipokinetic hormone n=1 Tax=Parnassius mnemosyne TaxID=213953 RepID=A0AAV1LAK9_9NEOP
MGVCVLVVALVSAQLTFSRDWAGGKRASPVAFDCNQFAQICRQFIHDLKQSLRKEKLSKHRKADREDLSLDYDDDKK